MIKTVSVISNRSDTDGYKESWISYAWSNHKDELIKLFKADNFDVSFDTKDVVVGNTGNLKQRFTDSILITMLD